MGSTETIYSSEQEEKNEPYISEDEENKKCYSSRISFWSVDSEYDDTSDEENDCESDDNTCTKL